MSHSMDRTNPDYRETLTREGFNNNEEGLDDSEAFDSNDKTEENLDEDEEDVSPFAVSENDEMSDIPSDKWDNLSH